MSRVVDETGPPAWFRDACASPSTTGSVEVAGATVCYERWGRATATAGARPLLLIHGTAANRRWWTHVAPLLAEHRPVVAMDLSGHGDSDHRATYDFSTWVEEVAAVLSDVAPTVSWHVVGHSLGGSIAAVAAQRMDLPLETVILCETIRNPRDSQHPVMVDRPRAYYPSRRSALDRFAKIEASSSSASFVLDHLADHSVVERPAGWTWKHDTALPVILQPIVPALDGLFAGARCPLAIVRGSEGKMPTSDLEPLLAVAGRPVPVVTIADCGHHPMLDAPLALIEVLDGLTTKSPTDDQ
jgi:pimeloyl-ACP methyl ester carboxylesterase